jgi:hypothetical protein
MARKSAVAGEIPEDVDLTLQERRVMDLRLTGKNFTDIAKEVGYAGPGSAYKALKRAMAKTLQEPADDLRRIEGERLDRLFEVAFAKATGEGERSLLAIDRCLTIQARRAALLGLDAPIRIEEHVISEDAVDAEMRRLSEQMAERGLTPTLDAAAS